MIPLVRKHFDEKAESRGPQTEPFFPSKPPPSNISMPKDKPKTYQMRVPDIVEHFRLSAIRNGDITVIRRPDHNRRNTFKKEVWHRVEDLGFGSFGFVRLDRRLQEGCEELRAVKEIRRSVRPSEPFEKDCARELYALARLSNDKYLNYFAEFYGWFESGKNVYLCMEYFQYGDLLNYIGSPLPESDTQDITVQLLSGLAIVHELGITHRDLKPDNIFVKERSPSWWVKIGDFGICKRIEDNDTYLQTIVGTKNFMAPEITNDDGEEGYTNAVDIWSLGCVVHMMLTSQVPFKDVKAVRNFGNHKSSFPRGQLENQGCSAEATSFIQDLLAADAIKRPSAIAAQSLAWLKNIRYPEIDQTTILSRRPTDPMFNTNRGYTPPNVVECSKEITHSAGDNDVASVLNQVNELSSSTETFPGKERRDSLSADFIEQIRAILRAAPVTSGSTNSSSDDFVILNLADAIPEIPRDEGLRSVNDPDPQSVQQSDHSAKQSESKSGVISISSGSDSSSASFGSRASKAGHLSKFTGTPDSERAREYSHELFSTNSDTESISSSTELRPHDKTKARRPHEDLINRSRLSNTFTEHTERSQSDTPENFSSGSSSSYMPAQSSLGRIAETEEGSRSLTPLAR